MSPLFLLVPILVPIIGGAGIVLPGFHEDRPREIYAEAVCCLTSVLVWIALLFGRRERIELYAFTRGFSIDLTMDGLSMLFAGMVSVMWPVVLLYAFEYLKHSKFKNVFFAFYVMTYGITLGIAFSGNMTTLYVFYEMLTLVTLPLVTHYGNHESMYAGRIYAAYTIGGASLSFFTMVLTTLNSGGANFEYGGCLNAAPGDSMLLLAFLFGFFGFGTKAALFPLSRWLPLASVAPTPVTALLHAVAVVNSGVFAVMRMAWYVYGPDYVGGTDVQHICLVTAAFTLVYAAFMALRARHFKRRLAWSTVSNLSYMLFGVLLMTPDGFKGGLAHMLFHGIIKMCLFLCAGAFMHQTANEYLYEVNGIGKRMPVTFACYTLGALSLAGIPLFCGFVSKWNLLLAAARHGTVWGMMGMIALIIAAFLCAMYTLTVAARAFFPMQGTDHYGEGSDVTEAGVRMTFPIVFFTVINVLFGVYPEPVLRLVTAIAGGSL